MVNARHHHAGRQRKAGFTLTELLVTVAIIGIIFSIGPRLFIEVNRFIILHRTKIELQRDARAILEIINKNLRQAYSSTIQIDQVTGQPYYSRISFTRLDNRSFTFYQQGTRLIMVSGGVSKTLTESLRYMAFTPPRTEDLTIISVSLTLEKGIYEAKSKALHMASEKVMVMN